MLDELSVEISQMITGINRPESLSTEKAVAFLGSYTTTAGTGGSEQAFEQVRITLNDDGTVAQAATIKPTNLRFNLGGLLMELLKGSVAIKGALESPATTLLFAIEFLKKIQKLATLEVSLKEAHLLMAIYRLSKERDALTIDHLKEVVSSSMSEKQMMDTLEKLERLSCIVLTMEGIEVQEVITVDRRSAGAN
jgi:hypothetical protein